MIYVYLFVGRNDVKTQMLKQCMNRVFAKAYVAKSLKFPTDKCCLAIILISKIPCILLRNLNFLKTY